MKNIIAGPTLPQNCIDGSMVSSSNGREAILVGCAEIPEKIYKLRWSNGTALEWALMKQKLKYPRNNAVAMLIPKALTQCNNYHPSKTNSKLNYLYLISILCHAIAVAMNFDFE